MSPIASITAKVLGNFGPEVTAVLGNAQGGLELLPSQAYGNGWLQVTHNGQTIKALPQQGDPYEEIYKLRGKWYGLLRAQWINPANHKDAGFEQTLDLLNKARNFIVPSAAVTTIKAMATMVQTRRMPRGTTSCGKFGLRCPGCPH